MCGSKPCSIGEQKISTTFSNVYVIAATIEYQTFYDLECFSVQFANLNSSLKVYL